MAALPLLLAAPGLGQTPQPTCFGLAATHVGTEGEDENLRGTPGDDVIVGLGGDDTIVGLAGNDRICGGDGDEIILADGDQPPFLETGDDLIDGGPGINLLEGGPGNDTFVGGEDVDLVSYLFAPGPIEVRAATNTGLGQGTDSFRGIEAFGGGPFDDLLEGDSGPNWFFGELGNDTVRGADGFDVMLFSHAAVARLGVPGHATGEGEDTLEALEGLSGSRARDVLTGADGEDFIYGSDGDDDLFGVGGEDRLIGGNGVDKLFGGPDDDALAGSAGNDELDGGQGTEDTATYLTAPNGIRANLAAHRITGEGTDGVRGVEAVSGTAFRDVLQGDVRANTLLGNAGRDELLGRGGNDFLNGGSGRDEADGGAGLDFCVQSERVRRCEPSRRTLSADVGGEDASATGLRPRAGTSSAWTRLRALRAVAACGIRCASGTTGRAPDRHAPDFLRSVMPLATLHLLAITPQEAIDYAGKAPTCETRNGQYTITFGPPPQVLPLDGRRSEKAVWRAVLVRIDRRGRETVFATADPARGDVAGGPGQTGWPLWKDLNGHTYDGSALTRKVPRGRYSWKASVTWEKINRSWPRRGLASVVPHRQPGKRPGVSCTFP